jgi:hypothetical protein
MFIQVVKKQEREKGAGRENLMNQFKNGVVYNSTLVCTSQKRSIPLGAASKQIGAYISAKHVRTIALITNPHS